MQAQLYQTLKFYLFVHFWSTRMKYVVKLDYIQALWNLKKHNKYSKGILLYIAAQEKLMTTQTQTACHTL